MDKLSEEVKDERDTSIDEVIFTANCIGKIIHNIIIFIFIRELDGH